MNSALELNTFDILHADTLNSSIESSGTNTGAGPKNISRHSRQKRNRFPVSVAAHGFTMNTNGLLPQHLCFGHINFTSTLCLKKTCKLWNGITQNCKDRFWHLAEIFKRLQNRVCMFQFSCWFAFLSSFRLSNWTPKITQCWRCAKQTRQLWRGAIFYKT